MKYIICTILCGFTCYAALAQKQVLSYPFQFEKSALQKSNYDAYFLDDNATSRFVFILKDNKKAEYVLVDKTFKVADTIKIPIEKTIFDISDNYLGGTAGNGIFYFVYKVSDKKAFGPGNIYYQMETVDFNNKTVNNKTLFQIPKAEKLITSFCDNNRYFTVACNDKTGELKFYTLLNNGTPEIKTVIFKVPESEHKDKRTISGYLKDITVIKQNDEPELESVIHTAKLFSTPNSLRLVVNDDDHPTHEININLNDFSTKEQFIPHDALFNNSKRSTVNSFLYGNTMFALVVNKQSITVGIYNVETGSVIKTYQFTTADDNAYTNFAQTPVYEARKGNKTREDDVEDIGKLIKALNNGTNGITVTKNKSGQYILTIGTYNLIPISSGGGGMMPTGSWTTPGVTTNVVTGSPSLTGSNYISSFKPGVPSYTSTSSRFYNTTYFKMLLDSSAGYKTTRGKLPGSVNAQIKDFMDDTDKKAKASNQFALGNSEYYGYYNSDNQAYEVEQIFIAK